MKKSFFEKSNFPQFPRNPGKKNTVLPEKRIFGKKALPPPPKNGKKKILALNKLIQKERNPKRKRIGGKKIFPLFEKYRNKVIFKGNFRKKNE